MSGILDLLQGDLGKQLISGVAAQTGQAEDKTSGVLQMALPYLLGSMKKNSGAGEESANGLLNALSNDKHDGSILDNLGNLFNGGVNEEVMKDGEGILGHVLGDKKEVVSQALSQQSGMDQGSVMDTMKAAAPVLMGMLGKQTRENNISSSNGIGDLLGGLFSGAQEQAGSSAGGLGFIQNLLDADGDGSIMDDVQDMLSGKNKGGIGGMLGGLFGK